MKRLLPLVGSLGALCCAPTIARADTPQRIQAPDAKTLPAAPDKAPRDPKPLSAEDLALVRDLALVENAELLKNLELFEARDDAQARAGKPAAPSAPR